MNRNKRSAGADIGIVGLGTMGRNFALNIADRGFVVAGFDRDGEKVRTFREQGGARVRGADSPAEFVTALNSPRAALFLVPAGNAVDQVIADLSPHLQRGDVLIDGGNSHFRDTERRQKELEGSGVSLLGVGISGGEAGARHGPCIMPGGEAAAYERVRAVFEAAAAHVAGEPCVTWLGRGGAGHLVKMVHNGIEYGLMQLIAESYDLLKRGWGLSNDELHRVFDAWNRSESAAFLIEITARIFLKNDDASDGRLIDTILDVARQKGTGMWTSQLAMELGEPAPTIDAAVTMRYLSALELERKTASGALLGAGQVFDGDRNAFLETLHNGFHASMLLTYAQGFALLRRASDEYGYDLHIEDIARIWRGGCIVRAAVLDRFMDATAGPSAPRNPLLDADIARELSGRQAALRTVVSEAALHGIPAPAFASAIAYYDAYRSARLPANLIQAQRDFFGSHTYERVDRDGVFHTDWDSE